MMYLQWTEYLFPPKIICWNLNPNMTVLGGGIFGRELYHEASGMRLVPLYKWSQRICLSSFHHVRTQQEMVTDAPVMMTSPGNKYTMNCLASEFQKNTFLLLISNPVCGTYSSLNGLWQSSLNVCRITMNDLGLDFSVLRGFQLWIRFL